MNNLHNKNASELVRSLANKEISSLELLEASIARIEELDKKINAVVVKDFDRARQAAKQADAAIAKGERAPLLGLPMTVKESFHVAGLTCTWGHPAFKAWQPKEDAVVVQRLKQAGAIIMGKTNVPFMLSDWQTYNAIYGTTNNPRDLQHTTGGSSGGSAAALAAGFTALELGSDMAGSLRVPAHYCGVYAHRPSTNLLPTRGGSPPTAPILPDTTNDLAVPGPMARNAEDLRLAIDVLAGPDEKLNGKAYQLKLPTARHDKLSDFRVLIIDEHPICPTASVVKNAINNLAGRLTTAGAKVSRNHQGLPDLAEITKNFVTMHIALVSQHMPKEQYERIALALKEGDNSFKAALMRGFVISHREWLHAMTLRKQLREAWRELYKEYDVILCPVMPTQAPIHDHSDFTTREINIDGVTLPYNVQYAWQSIASLFGLPATVAPIAISENELPIGIQIIADYLDDYTSLKFAELL